MIKIYGSMLCPDCVDIRTLYDKHNISYVFLDFGETTQHIKDFLKLRDTNPLFDPIKANGQIGIPCIILEDGTVTLTPEDALELL